MRIRFVLGTAKHYCPRSGKGRCSPNARLLSGEYLYLEMERAKRIELS